MRYTLVLFKEINQNHRRIGRGRRLNVCEANFTLSEAKQFDRPAGVQ